MNKIAVVYWSGTGNTEQMAAAVAEGAKGKGGQVELIEASGFDAAKAQGMDAIAFGCPSMGAEVLEEDVFQPMWDTVLPKLSGKRIGLFGSYGWGDGEWMRNWEKACENAGLLLAADCVICQEAPDEAATAACRALGQALAG